MPKCLQAWTVYPHGPIEKLEENLWRVEAKLPTLQINRTLTVARLKDRRLVIHNAIALGDAEMSELEAFGKPTFLIVPNGGHRLDCKIWKERYPALTVIAPAGARKKVEECVPVDEVDGHFGDETVFYKPLAGTLDKEGFLQVKSESGITVVLNDVVMNSPRGTGFSGWLFQLLGFTGPAPRVAPLPMLLLVKDPRALREELLRLAALPGLKRVIVSHGAPLDGAQLRTAVETHL